jgi:hypothetical protein
VASFRWEGIEQRIEQRREVTLALASLRVTLAIDRIEEVEEKSCRKERKERERQKGHVGR